MVKAAVRVSSGVPPFLFPFGLSARRRAERFGRWGHPESLLEQADWGGVAGAGVRAGGAKTGSRSRSLGGAAAGRPGFRGGGLFPRRQRQFRSGRAKKQATKRRTKKDFPSPKRRRFVKTGFTRNIRKKVVWAGPAAPKAKDDRRTRLWKATSPRGAAISGSPWLETAAPFRVKFRQIRGPGYPAPKHYSAAEKRLFS